VLVDIHKVIYNLPVMPAYRLERLDSDEFIVIDRWSYVWAALAGPIYVVSKGFYRLAALMTAITLFLATVAFLCMLIAVQLFDASVAGLTAMVACVGVALLLNGVAGVRLVHRGYLSAGWRMGY
jgi:ABC-type siderophore export system fused ATPase/permease subunit